MSDDVVHNRIAVLRADRRVSQNLALTLAAVM